MEPVHIVRWVDRSFCATSSAAPLAEPARRVRLRLLRNARLTLRPTFFILAIIRVSNFGRYMNSNWATVFNSKVWTHSLKFDLKDNSIIITVSVIYYLVISAWIGYFLWFNLPHRRNVLILYTSVVDPDPPGSTTFRRIRIHSWPLPRIRIHSDLHPGSGSGSTKI